MTNHIRRVTVLGAGVLGSQIAFQTAFKGFDVTSYDIDDAALGDARQRYDLLVRTYLNEVPAAQGEDNTAAPDTLDRLTLTSDLAAAVADADLVIEAIPEILELKRETYRQIGALAPAKTIFATNSSTLLPSDLAESTGRPDRFLALHFANRVWAFNTAEVMGTPQTDPAVFAEVVAFAEAIGMVPIELHREKAGYVLNSLLVPFLKAGVELAAGGYAEPAAVDDTWRIATGAPLGPFQILDIVGMHTAYNILSAGDAEDQQLAGWVKANYIDRGKLGIATSEGFYKYV